MQKYGMHAFLHRFLVLWTDIINTPNAISKCIREIPRLIIFRCIAVYSASENFTWLTSPHIWCKIWNDARVPSLIPRVVNRNNLFTACDLQVRLRNTAVDSIQVNSRNVYSAFENFTSFTSPHIWCRNMHAFLSFLYWFLVLWMGIIYSPNAIP